jgi:hypothetical protein
MLSVHDGGSWTTSQDRLSKDKLLVSDSLHSEEASFSRQSRKFVFCPGFEKIVSAEILYKVS